MGKLWSEIQGFATLASLMDGHDSKRPTPAAARRPPIQPEMTVRQVASDYPGCREVFLRLGEPDGRPTKFGHLEPLDRFAKRSGIPLGTLLEELSSASGVPVDLEAARQKLVHRPFVVAALLTTLSLGAGWGALLLMKIGWRRSFDSVSAADVVAHGEAQLWGFVAVFVMGISLSYLPAVTGRSRPKVWRTRLLLMVVLLGVLGGFAWSMAPGRLSGLGPFSGLALVLAALGYLSYVFWQLAEKWRTPWGRFLVASTLWMVVWAVVELVLRIATKSSGPGIYSDRTRTVLMELAIFGFAQNSIYGFGQKLLPGFLRGGSTRRELFEITWIVHNAGVLALCLTHLADLTGKAWVGSVSIVVGALLFVVALRGLFRRRQAASRPEAGHGLLPRYIQLAFCWLLISLVMLAAGDLATALRGAAPPHPYLGALRHALTVGFMTTLILGVGQRLIPILEHRLLTWPALVTPIFVLIAAGNALRVATELATLVWPPAFPIMSFSSILELSALSLFAANVLRTLWPPVEPWRRTGLVTAQTRLASLLAEHPWLEDHLISRGLHYLGRARAVPNELTLGSFIKGEGFEIEDVVDRVNTLMAGHAPDHYRQTSL